MRLSLIPVSLLVARAAAADPCPPTVVLQGASAAEVGELLSARGIAVVAEQGACPAVRATLGAGGAVEIVELDGSAVERAAPEARTAATVIESFVRADVGAPLLASRPIKEEAAAVIAVAPAPVVHGPPRRGVQVFGAFETSFADDHTGWAGAHVGACVMFGPVCPAARLRFASVERQPEGFAAERHNIELLVGLDIPFAVGGAVLAPGFAAGLGQMHTRAYGSGSRAETGGMRADVHATLSLPLTKRLAFDVFAAGVLTQQTDIEQHHDESMAMDGSDVEVTMPAEPRFLVRLGIGIHYGGL